MKLLLDTHMLLWAAGNSQRLPEATRALLLDQDNDLVFSVASFWEIVIKSGLGRDDFRVDAALLRRELRINGYEELPIAADHVLAVANLPPLHKDPFDRLLIAQATVEGMTLITTDPLVAGYPGPIRAV
jgi:PIN domain nuclease of toxin-antitoxin system